MSSFVSLYTFNSHRAAIEETMPAVKESIKEMKLQCYRTLEQKKCKPSGAPVLFVGG